MPSGSASLSKNSDNLLPRDGRVQYWPEFLSRESADQLSHELYHEVPWENDVCILFGRRMVTGRKVAWYADDRLAYRYSGSTKTGLPWTPVLQTLRTKVQSSLGASFNSCLLNLYENGSQGMGWHSDDERTLGKHPMIASVSIGAVRKFSFKHRVTRETFSLSLAHGSLLVMSAETQHHWVHSLPKTKTVNAERINLTFRTIYSMI